MLDCEDVLELDDVDDWLLDESLENEDDRLEPLLRDESLLLVELNELDCELELVELWLLVELLETELEIDELSLLADDPLDWLLDDELVLLSEL